MTTMEARGMWLRLDDGFAEHPKIVELSDRAFRVHVVCMLYSARNLTDGRVPASFGRTERRAVAELVEHGVWKPMPEGGWAIHDWDEWNPSAESVRLRRLSDRDRKRRHRRGPDGRWTSPDDGE